MSARPVRISPRLRWVGACLGGASLVLSVSSVDARKRGIAVPGCDGCHGEVNNSTIRVGPLTAEPGETVVLRFEVADADARVGGIFVEAEDLGGIAVPGGEPLAIVNYGVTHTSPKAFSKQSLSFELSYQVPATPGSTRFSAWVVAGNDNGQTSGDEGNHADLDLVYGCSPQVYYADLDRDGHGRAEPVRTACAGYPPEGYADSADDCDDNMPARHPGAIELCNGKDDDCDGEVDEDAEPLTLYPDADGDGYYSYEEWKSGDSVVGCLPNPGYAAEGGDCNPDLAEVHPGAEEVCDERNDEDCDGQVDERVKPTCGEGWCRRESRTCSPEDCTPGEPAEEECNFQDDDCDGEVDEGDLCPPGQACLAGACRDARAASGGASDFVSKKQGQGACAVQAPGSFDGPSAWLGWFVALGGALWLRRGRVPSLFCVD